MSSDPHVEIVKWAPPTHPTRSLGVGEALAKLLAQRGCDVVHDTADWHG